MAEDNITFEIIDCRLLILDFAVNKEFVPGPDVPIEIKLEMLHAINSDNLLTLTVRVIVSGESSPLKLTTEFGGLFNFPQGLPAAGMIPQIAEINCAAILFPFAREVIADVTRRAGLSPLILQPFNFVELFQRNHPA